jgi:hypothetical protein
MHRYLIPFLGLILVAGSACAPAETTPSATAVNAGRGLDNTSPSNPTGPGSLDRASPATGAGWSGRFGY